MAEIKHRLKHGLRSDMSNDSSKPDQVTNLTRLIRTLRADLGERIHDDEHRVSRWTPVFTGVTTFCEFVILGLPDRRAHQDQ